jgi:hypothetical protein
MKANFLLFIFPGSFLATATFTQNKPTPAFQAQGRVIRVYLNNPKGTLNTIFKECVNAEGTFTKVLGLRENDVFLLNLVNCNDQ